MAHNETQDPTSNKEKIMDNETIIESITDFGTDIGKELVAGIAIVAFSYVALLAALQTSVKITEMRDARRIKKFNKKNAVA